MCMCHWHTDLYTYICQNHKAVQWRIVPVQNRLAVMFCDSVQLFAIRFSRWIIVEWLRRWTQKWAAEGVLEILRPAFATWFRLVKQFAHIWNLPCYSWNLPCYHVSSIQNNIYIYINILIGWFRQGYGLTTVFCVSDAVFPWTQEVFIIIYADLVIRRFSLKMSWDWH